MYGQAQRSKPDPTTVQRFRRKADIGQLAFSAESVENVPTETTKTRSAPDFTRCRGCAVMDLQLVPDSNFRTGLLEYNRLCEGILSPVLAHLIIQHLDRDRVG